MALQNDDFNDNSIDAFWTKLEGGTGSVAETNNQLECSCPANTDVAGLCTNESHDLTTCDIQVDVNNDALQSQELYICLTKVTAATPYSEDDWYRIIKYNVTDVWSVQRNVAGGGVESLASGAWTGASGSLRIRISAGTITFYEEGNNRHSEAYALSTYTAYVILNVRGVTNYLGMDVFDNFLGSSGLAPRHGFINFQDPGIV